MKPKYTSENRCLNKVASVVSEEFNCKFLQFTSDIDNGLDGVILWRENGSIIDSIYVQCKGGDSYLPVLRGHNYSSRFQIYLPKDYVKKHYYIWKAVNGPVIMVVCNNNGKAWWINLKDDTAYDDEHNHLFGNPENRFNKAARYRLNELVRHQKYLKGRAKINIKGEILNGCLGKSSIKKIAQDYYKSLGKEPMMTLNPDLDRKIEFTRVGWRHILRRKRRKSRIIQSLLLLPLIPAVLENSEDYTILDVKISKGENGEDIVLETIGIQAACEFNYRFPSIIHLILLRKTVFMNASFKERIWFYSIYEIGRNEKISEVVIE